MEVGDSFSLAIADPSQVGEARRRAGALATERGLNETDAGRVGVIVTEMAGNLIKHATQGGELLVRALLRGDTPGIEVLALDRGPGMEDVGRCLQDGYSTAGSPGTGLGAVSRMSDLFQLHSAPGVGTGLLARVWARREEEPARGRLQLGVVNRAMPGQAVCGDDWAVVEEAGRLRIMVVDGLGHGPGAAEAAAEASRAFRAHAHREPAAILELMHAGMRGTRGAAVAVAEIDGGRGELCFAGIGNIAAMVQTGAESRSLVSMNGIVGHEMRKVQPFTYAWTAGSMLIVHSDGVSARWSLDRYAGLAARHPALIAGVLYRDFGRANDDATVVAVRQPAPAAGGAPG